MVKRAGPPAGKPMNASIAKLIEEFEGAELMLKWSAPTWTGTRKDQLKTIVRARDLDEGAWDYEFTDQPADVCVVWDRPVQRIARHRIALRSWMSAAGIYDDRVAHVYAYPVSVQEPPTVDQVERFRSTTMRAVEVVGANYVLLVGGISAGLWRRELKLRQMEGKLGIWEDKYLVWCVQNPIQCIADPHLIGPIRSEVVRFCQAVREGWGLGELETACTEDGCSDTVWMWDRDGLPWCRRHQDEAMKARDRMRKGVRTWQNRTMQGAML